MESIFEEIGIPKKYLKKTVKDERYIALVNKLWLKSLIKYSKLIDFIEKWKLESWPTNEDELDLNWTKIFITVFMKRDSKVIPLPRIRPLAKEDNPLMFSQLMQYISQTNYKNLWRDAYKKYSNSVENKETQVALVEFNDVLREIILRIYGCPIINATDPSLSTEISKNFNVHMNILPAVCAVETLNAIFLLHIPYIEHNLTDCVTFSPAILEKCYAKPLFIVYQLLQLMKSLHDRSLTLGDITLTDIYLSEDMWIYVFPQISSNIYIQELPKFEAKNTTIRDCRKLGHKFDPNTLKCESCGIRTYDKVQITNESLEGLCQLWIEGKLSNFSYISALNRFSGRKLEIKTYKRKSKYGCTFMGKIKTKNLKSWRTVLSLSPSLLRRLVHEVMKSRKAFFWHCISYKVREGSELHHSEDKIYFVIGDPNCHYVFPWVTDFASRCGKNWRDLKKSKYRINKGDRQLDLTYDNSQSQVPHHVSDVLSCITYYVYMARRTPKSVLCKNVRTIWVPAEYPSSIQRLQEWTPDECIPEFFADPGVFRSIHDDLDDLEVPPWASGPEDFIEKHREALESSHVSERLHYWIDLTFGYKLSGTAAIKAKNVCLHLADEHTNLTKSGIAQLFTFPHPPKAVTSQFCAKIPPKIYVNKPTKQRTRDRSNSSQPSYDLLAKSDDETLDIPSSTSNTNRSPLALTKILSRSRSSLNEEQSNSKPNRSPVGQRSASLGPKNPSFTSHVTVKTKSTQLTVPIASLNTGIIYLPKEYKPEGALESLEKRYSFVSKTFHTESSKKLKNFEEEPNLKDGSSDDCIVQNAFTNFIFTESFEKMRSSKPKATKSYTFPMDIYNMSFQNLNKKPETSHKSDNRVICHYSDIISSRRVRELQILGCLIVEIFLSKQMRALGLNNPNLTFVQRLKSCLTVVKSCKCDIPPCVAYVISLLLQPDIVDLKNFSYPVVTDFGLPPPSAHLLLEPLLHCIIPFPKQFFNVYNLVWSLKEFKNVALDLAILYHFDCDGTACAEYEHVERTKTLFAQNIAECKVKLCAKHLENVLDQINTNTDTETVNILLPYIRELIEDPPTSVLAAWFLFDPIARALGPQRAMEELLDSLLKLYENDPNDIFLPYNNKIAKLYHHSFLLRLMVRLGLKCFLENFVTPLVEAVGGYKDWEKSDFILHTHSAKVLRKTSHLKTMDVESNEMSVSDDSSVSSERPVFTKKDLKPPKEEEIFELDEEKDSEEQMKSLIEHLELNITSDLPFNHSTAEEALDATLTENIDELRNLEELNINLSDLESGDGAEQSKSVVTSPNIPIPSSYQNSVINISCEIGSRKSESDSLQEKKSLNSQTEFLDSPNSSNCERDRARSISNSSSYTSKLATKLKRSDPKISDMSVESIIWLSHRLGPVLMARYLSRNLLKMLTLCYVSKENLMFVPNNDRDSSNDITVTSSRVVGDQNAAKVINCLTTIAALYGEQLILFQYIPHMTELIALCKRKLTPNLEGGVISCLALLKHIIPYLSDTTLMDQLQDVLLKNIIHPIVRLMGSTKYTFPTGQIARNVLARKYVDALYVLSIRMGSDMTKKYLAVPALQRFFLIFDKVHENWGKPPVEEKVLADQDLNFLKTIKESHYAEPEVSTRVAISHVRLKDSESFDSISPTHTSSIGNEETAVNSAVQELKAVFTPEFAYTSYLPFLRHVGASSLEISLKNHETIKNLCQEHEQELKSSQNILSSTTQKVSDSESSLRSIATSSSIGSNINVIGNRLDVQTESFDSLNASLLSLVSNRMDNNTRHLRGNWLAYWEHEIGRSEKDTMFNFNQIKLQTFVGHANSVKCLYVLDNENSFMSGSRDKTVKLWSLRSQGDGLATSVCQWTYTAHRKSILSLTFVDTMRLAASCDSVVHIWDPFMGANIGHLESSRYSPVNVLKSMPAPSTLVYAATTEGTVRIIDVRLCSYVYDFKINVNPTGLIRCLVIAPSGLWVAAGQSSGCITVLDARTGLVVSSWRAHESEVLQLIAVDNDTLVSSSLDQNMSVWKVADGKFKFHMKGATEPVHCLTVHDRELISGTTANRIGVHTSVDPDASFSSTKLRSDAFKGLLTSMALLPLNRLLLLGADTGHITLLC